jgi:8-oxo-dGTP pyrophosphatase MutT (NUDIX family)
LTADQAYLTLSPAAANSNQRPVVSAVNDPEQRRSARLVLLDEEGCVLLFKHLRKDGSAFWALPGGGAELGETFEQAALREAEEELGLKGFAVNFLWKGWADFVYVDTPVRQHECFFLLHAQMRELSTEVRKMDEDEGIIEMRWWSTSAIASTSEPVFPEGLAAELNKLIDQ